MAALALVVALALFMPKDESLKYVGAWRPSWERGTGLPTGLETPGAIRLEPDHAVRVAGPGPTLHGKWHVQGEQIVVLLNGHGNLFWTRAVATDTRSVTPPTQQARHIELRFAYDEHNQVLRLIDASDKQLLERGMLLVR